MSVWLYDIRTVEVSPGADFDDQIGKVLHDAGAHGWELVQVLRGTGTDGDKTQRMIFKTEKPLIG